jgi:hypothetical protein
VKFSWKRNKARKRAEGFTRDISSGGMFVLAKTFPPKRAAVRCEVLLSSTVTHEQLRMDWAGRVTRVERHVAHGAKGFAIHCEKLVSAM